MDIPELTNLAAAVQKELHRKQQAGKAEMSARIVAMAVEGGIDLKDLAATVKVYRNPANHTETWLGRGAKPNWLKALLASGRDLQEFAI